MKIVEQLKEELKTPASGAYAPQYFRYLGYRKDLKAPMPILRANGIYSLFADSKPHVFVYDLIAGNTRSLFCSVDETVLQYSINLTNAIGLRDFPRNADHFSPDYQRVLTEGVPGLIESIDRSLETHKSDAKKTEYLHAMRLTLEGFMQMMANYAKEAESLKSNPEYDKDRLDFIINNIKELLEGAPKTFGAALQLVWFCHTAFMMEGRNAMALGRIDQYLYPFYKKDIDEGRITDDEVTELLENIFMKIPHHDTVNIAIGGMDKAGNCQINGLTWCVLHAVGNCNVPGPNLSARVTPNTPDEFLDECLKTIGTGLGYPALMNDTVNIAALKQYGYDEEDVYNYTMVGCIENFMTGMQPPWTDGRFDTPRFFDYVFNNGISKTSVSVGLELGDVENIHSMQEFMENYEAQLSYGVDEYCINVNSWNNSINQQYFLEPFLSCFCYDCIGRGLDINNGGSKYPSVHGAVLMGVGTVADSLAAIEKVVFVDKEATLTDIKNALNNDFEGYEDLRQKLLAAPKYGNNDNFADKYAVWFLDYLSDLFAKHRTRDGGYFYVAMAANVANIYAGLNISATPDGRKKGEPLSDAASPTYGRDTKGATVTLNSVSKPDYAKAACGTVVNQKFSPSMFKEPKRSKLLALIKTYFKQGGQEVQINATSPEVLKDAMDNPEKYQDLVVRVSGFSAFYVTLDRRVQQDILSRTQQE